MTRRGQLLFSFMILSLVGCSSGDGDQSIGYFSNEHWKKDNQGEVRFIDHESDGIFIEMLDRTTRNEWKGMKENRRRKLEQAIYNRHSGEYRYSLEELERPLHANFFEQYDGDLSMEIEQLATTIVNVADAHAIIYQNKIILAVVLEDLTRAKETKEKIIDVMDKYSNGKELHVVMDDHVYEQVQKIDERLRKGAPIAHVKQEIDKLLGTVSNL